MGWGGKMDYSVVDTSVVFKLVLAYGESGLDEAWALMRRHRDREILLVAPELAAIEIASIIRHVGVNEPIALEFLTAYRDLAIELIPATPARIRAALSTAFAHQLSIYDAMFLALAQELDCELVTADLKAFGAVPEEVAKVRLI